MERISTQDGPRLELAPSDPPGRGEAIGAPWWERRWGVFLILLLAALPLLWPEVPPLGDLPGHMGRYRVELEVASSAELQRFYSFHWQVIGNLGVDLLVVPLSALFGLEPAVKLIVVAIPVLTVVGFLWVAREVHGHVPAATIFALPLAYSYPLQFGFVNFALSMALALIAFGLWLRLGRLERPKLRAAIFLPLSLLIWVAHVHGWATLCVMAFMAELSVQLERGKSPADAGLRAVGHCLALAPPLLAMIVWRSGDANGFTGDWFDVGQKLKYLAMPLRDQWLLFDLASLAVLLGLIGAAARSRRLRFARNAGMIAVVLLALFAMMPRVIFGSSYADMRLVPYIYAVALLAIAPTARADGRFLRRLALAATAFLLVRTAANTVSLWIYDRSYDRELAALSHLPRGARLVSFVGRPCGLRWRVTRLEHLPGLALARNRAFSNDQWDMAGGQPSAVIYAPAGSFGRDRSEIVRPNGCVKPNYRTIRQALRGFPRQAFDYVWLIQPPPYTQSDA
ncbi:MAG: hypothetical protein ACXWIO_09925, partial [Croceibacterium sp.]